MDAGIDLWHSHLTWANTSEEKPCPPLRGNKIARAENHKMVSHWIHPQLLSLIRKKSCRLCALHGTWLDCLAADRHLSRTHTLVTALNTGKQWCIVESRNVKLSGMLADCSATPHTPVGDHYSADDDYGNKREVFKLHADQSTVFSPWTQNTLFLTKGI